MNEQKKQDILSMFIRTTNPRCPNCETNSLTGKFYGGESMRLTECTNCEAPIKIYVETKDEGVAVVTVEVSDNEME
jgi:uncharacterized protein (DUF983 family)